MAKGANEYFVQFMKTYKHPVLQAQQYLLLIPLKWFDFFSAVPQLRQRIIKCISLPLLFAQKAE